MSEHDPLLDELLSAHLDGETTADEAAQIQRDLEHDDALRVRFDELASARAATRDAFRSDAHAVAATDRDEMLRRVFDELDAEATVAATGSLRDPAQPSDDGEGQSTLTPITQLSKRRRDPSRFLAAAAAVVAVVLLGGAIAMLASESGRNGGDDSASAPESTGTEMSADAAESGASSGGADGRGSGSEYLMPATATSDLGSFADAAQLGDTVRAVLRDADRSYGSLPAESAPADGPSVPSSEENRGATTATEASCVAPSEFTAAYTAELADRAVFVVVIGDHAVVLDQQTCTEVLRITPQ